MENFEIEFQPFQQCLPSRAESAPPGGQSSPHTGKHGHNETDDFQSHAIKLLKLSGNLALQSLGGFAIWMSTFIWIGTLGPAVMGGMTLGNMLCNITGYSLIFGMATALDSLCAQSFGARQYQRLGLHVQKAILILTLFSLPVIAVWYNSEWLLHNLLFIPSELAFHGGRWSRTLAAGLWPLMCFECLKKGMQARNIVWPAVLTTSLGLCFNLATNYYVLRIRRWGFDGAAWIVPLQNWVHLFLLVGILSLRKAYIYRERERRRQGTESAAYDKLPEESAHGERTQEIRITNEEELKATDEDPENDWPPLGPEVFEGWGEFLRLGIPGAASLFIEWGSFELAASIAGQLGAVGLAAHGVFMSTSGLFYMLPLSIAQATTTVAGHIIGGKMSDAGQIAARKIIMLGVAIDTIYGLTAAAVLMLAVRPIWGSIFTSDVATQQLVWKTMPMMALYAVVDATKCITLNILRSGGLPSITVFVNGLVCICVMTPLGWYLAIKQHQGLSGLWFSMSVAWGLATLCFGCILGTLDLRKLKVLE